MGIYLCSIPCHNIISNVFSVYRSLIFVLIVGTETCIIDLHKVTHMINRFYPFRTGIDYRRQNLTSIDVGF